MITLEKQLKNILAVDVGAGTQDVLFFEPSKEPENNLKFVIPSQTQLLARKISRFNEDLLITGETMGGGPVTMAILGHIKKGYQVFMTETSAKTVRDDLEDVQSEGIEVISEEEAAGLNLSKIETKDIDLDFLFNLIGDYSGLLPDFIGIAVQDHGFEKNKSDRVFRFEKIKETLDQRACLEDFLFDEPPDYYTRMNAVLRQVKKSFKGGAGVIDSKFAAIAGALHDVDERPCICIDVGNGHTMIAIVDDGIESVLEHHTHTLTQESIVDYINRLADGTISNEEVFNDNGHGCFIKTAPGIKNIKRILVSGPNRNVLKNSSLNFEFANPFGDVMMTGPVGIVDLVKSKFF
jgi:uncharacterized protein (DUF1786 family)